MNSKLHGEKRLIIIHFLQTVQRHDDEQDLCVECNDANKFSFNELRFIVKYWMDV